MICGEILPLRLVTPVGDVLAKVQWAVEAIQMSAGADYGKRSVQMSAVERCLGGRRGARAGASRCLRVRRKMRRLGTGAYLVRSEAELARTRRTSRTVIHRFLDPRDTRVTSATLSKASKSIAAKLLKVAWNAQG